MTSALAGISSMATARLLDELTHHYHEATAVTVRFEAAGGVDLARRVAAGEAFDLVVLDAERIGQMILAGHVLGDGRIDLAQSETALAVRSGSVLPDIGNRTALVEAILAAPSIGYSTGPSGLELIKRFGQWGIADAIRERLVQAPVGVPVGSLVAKGEAALGFQQLSELMPVTGIEIVGRLPPDAAIISTFSAGICSASTKRSEARNFLTYLNSSATDEFKRRHGMTPCARPGTPPIPAHGAW